MRNLLRRNVVGIVLMIVVALLPCASAARADEIHVPADFPTIQAAVNAAVDGDEVIIADGVYSGAGNRELNFQGKAITVRSENGPDNCIVDIQRENRGFLFFNGETNASVLDGLTVRNAFHQTFQPDLLRGGAIFIEDASPSISNCIFADNDLDSNGFVAFGGAIYSSGDPILTNCIFDTNSIFGGSLAGGGAFYNDGGDPQFFDCHFQNNSSTSWPGAIGAAFGGAIGGVGSVTLTGCTFVDNDVLSQENSTGGAVATDKAMLIDCYFEANRVSSQGAAKGGAIAITDESSQVINCSFFNNDAIACCVPAKGGAINGPGTLLNCLFVGNVADNGGGYAGAGSVLNCTFVANEAGLGAAIDGAAQVSNSVAWNNVGNPINGAEVTYSNIQGGYDGEGNIDADPLFVDPDNATTGSQRDHPASTQGATTPWRAPCLISMGTSASPTIRGRAIPASAAHPLLTWAPTNSAAHRPPAATTATETVWTTRASLPRGSRPIAMTTEFLIAATLPSASARIATLMGRRMNAATIATTTDFRTCAKSCRRSP